MSIHSSIKVINFQLLEMALRRKTQSNMQPMSVAVAVRNPSPAWVSRSLRDEDHLTANCREDIDLTGPGTAETAIPTD